MSDDRVLMIVEGLVVEVRVTPEFRFGRVPEVSRNAEFLVLVDEQRVVTVPCRSSEIPTGGERVRLTVEVLGAG